VVARELVVVEVVEGGFVAVSDVYDERGGIGEVGGGGLAARDGRGVGGEEETAGDELVFVRAAGMSKDASEWDHAPWAL
jgi:hypothetical protein